MISSASPAHSDPSYQVLSTIALFYPLIAHFIPPLIVLNVLISAVFNILSVSNVSILVSAVYRLISA